MPELTLTALMCGLCACMVVLYVVVVPELTLTALFRSAWVRPTYSYNAHAYALTSAGIGKLLAAHFERNLIPVDEFLPSL